MGLNYSGLQTAKNQSSLGSADFFSVEIKGRKTASSMTLMMMNLKMNLKRNFLIIKFVKNWNHFPRIKVDSPAENFQMGDNDHLR